MWAMAGSVLLWLLDQFMKKQQLDEDMKKAYYDFLDQADKKGLAKVALWQSGESARERLVDRVKKRYEQEQSKNDGSV